MNGKKIYFASDFHLGSPDRASSLVREKLIVRWLEEIRQDAHEVYLLGDIFDFWFEYKAVIPRGFVRLLGKIAELTDAGIPVHFVVGNHDMWAFGYLLEELSVTVHRGSFATEIGGKSFFLGHGDGVGPGDKTYKFLKRIFSSGFCQWLFARLHPNMGISIARYWSRRSRTGLQADSFLGEDKECQILYAKQLLKDKHIDFFVFGHRHLPLNIPLNAGSRYINLGDWLSSNSYAVFDGNGMELRFYPGKISQEPAHFKPSGAA